jgi:uncharacterized protein (TIGR03067 family)
MRFLMSVAVCFTLSAVLAAPVPKEKGKEKLKDEDAIVGTWRVVEIDYGGGQKLLPDHAKQSRYTFGENGAFSITDPRQPTANFTFKLDPSSKPKAMDWIVNGQPLSILGLYELDGDTLKFCMSQKQPTVRPTELKGDDATLTWVWALKRVMDEKMDK